MEEDVRERIQKLLVTGRQPPQAGRRPGEGAGELGAGARARAGGGLEERIRPLVEVRLADLEQPIAARLRIASIRSAWRLDVVLGRRPRARRRSGTGSAAACTSPCAEAVDVERIDEHAGLRRDELRRAADPRRDDRAPAGHRLEQRLAERLDEARLREDVGSRRAARDLVVRDAPEERARPARPSSCGAQRPVADERERALGRARANASARRTTFFRSVERADAEEARAAPGGASATENRSQVDAARDDLRLAARLGQLRLELAPQVVGDADHRGRAPHDEPRRGRDARDRADVAHVAAVRGDDERRAAASAAISPDGTRKCA